MHKKFYDKMRPWIFEEGYKPEKTPIVVPSEIRAIVSGVLKGFIPKIRVIAKEELSKDYRLDVISEI